MNSELGFKIIKGRGVYGSNPNVKSISEVFKTNPQSNKCKQLRIMHCANLSSVEGIEQCKSLTILNLSSNKISSIQNLSFITHLQQLDLKANRLRSLKGIQNLSRMIKLDASQNLIQSLQCFNKNNSQLQSIILYQNNFSNIQQLAIFKQFTNLKQIIFQKNNKSNPFCQDKPIYHQQLKLALMNSLRNIQKIDDFAGEQIQSFFVQKKLNPIEEKSYNQQYSKQPQSYQQQEHSNYLQNKRIITSTQQFNLTSQKLFHLTQRQQDLQRLVDIKDDALQQLKHKNAQLEMTNANFYKDSLKKQIEYERITGQISEISKQIDHKDNKINQLHRRIQQLLKINANANNSNQVRANQMQKIRKEANDLKIQNAQLRVLNKDQQSRLRQLQNKALSNIEDKSQKIEELRRRNQDLLKQNYQIQRQQDQYKDRFRQLTQLLKQWEYKYEHKVKEMETFHNNQRSQLLKQFELREQELIRNNQDHIKKIYSQFQNKINSLEKEYSQALESSLEKYSKLKKSYDQRCSSQTEMKALAKTFVNKNSQQEQTINECQKVIIQSRKMITQTNRENETLLKQNSELKTKYQIDVKTLQNDLSKVQFQRNRFQQENKDLKMSNEYLQNNFDKLGDKDKYIQQLEQKNQNLQTALDTKTVMMDHNNETIENLKLQIENLQKQMQEKIDRSQIQKINTKYRKSKEKSKQLQEKVAYLQNQNKQLNDRLETERNLEQQFSQVRDILTRYETELNEKKENQVQLIAVIQKMRVNLKNLQDQNAVLRVENNKILLTIQDKQNRWNRLLKEKQRQTEQKISKMNQQTNKLKQIVRHLNQISNLTKGIAF